MENPHGSRLSHPTVFAKSRCLDPEKLEIQKRDSNVWNPPPLFAVQNHHGPLPSTWCPKKMDPDDCGYYHRLNLVTTWTNTLCQTGKTFPMAYMVATFFQKLILSRVITKSLLQPQKSQKQRLSHHLACLSICSRLLGCLTLHRPFNE